MSMQKLSGLVLDFKDDNDGEVLRSIWPSAEDLPDLVKTAQKITPELEKKIPDDLFAIVMHDGDVTLRKYACIDAGNTALSVEYFLKTAGKLPDEAQKLAAQNLLKACSWYGIEPPEQLEKVAIGAVGLAMGALTLPGAASEAKKNLQASSTAGGQVLTPQQIKQLRMMQGGA